MSLPNFIVIGAHKAGTTSLYHYLRAHPSVYMPELKEARFFAFDQDNPDHLKKIPKVFPITSMDNYIELFDNVHLEKAIGEASPEYLNSEFAARKIYQHIPNVKLIVSLRNPIDRAYSLFMMAYRSGNISGMVPEEFEFDNEQAREGAYYSKLKVYMDLFGRQSVKVILFEDLIKDTENTIKDIFKFLEVSEDFEPELSQIHNPGGIPKSRMIYNLSRNRIISKSLKNILPESLISGLKSLKNKNLTKSPKFDIEKRKCAVRLIKDDIIKVEELINRDLSSWYQLG